MFELQSLGCEAVVVALESVLGDGTIAGMSITVERQKKYALLLLRFQAILLQKDKICSWEERDKKRGG